MLIGLLHVCVRAQRVVEHTATAASCFCDFSPRSVVVILASLLARPPACPCGRLAHAGAHQGATADGGGGGAAAVFWFSRRTPPLEAPTRALSVGARPRRRGCAASHEECGAALREGGGDAGAARLSAPAFFTPLTRRARRSSLLVALLAALARPAARAVGPGEQTAVQSARAAHSSSIFASVLSASVLDGAAELLVAGDTRGGGFGGDGRAGGSGAGSVSGESVEATDAADVCVSGPDAGVVVGGVAAFVVTPFIVPFFPLVAVEPAATSTFTLPFVLAASLVVALGKRDGRGFGNTVRAC